VPWLPAVRIEGLARPLTVDGVTLRHAVAADLRSAKASEYAAMAGLGAGLAYEWGPGNESVVSWLAANLIDDAEGWNSILVPATVSAGLALVQQVAAGLIALHAFRSFRRTQQAALLRFDHHSWLHVEPGVRRLAVTSFLLGATAVALAAAIRDGARTSRQTNTGRREVLTGAAGSAAITLALVAGVASIALLGRSYASTAPVTERVVDIAANPLVWSGAIALYLLGVVVRRRVR